MVDIARLRALTGITVEQLDDTVLMELLELHDGQVFCAAAEAADRMATGLVKSAGVTAVEDISIDRGGVIDAWTALADRLRARCEREQAEAWDDGPSVVEFRPWGIPGPEAVEHVHP